MQSAIDRFAEGFAYFPRLVLDALYTQMLDRIAASRSSQNLLRRFARTMLEPVKFLRELSPEWPVVGIPLPELTDQFARYKALARVRLREETSSGRSDRELREEDGSVSAQETPVELQDLLEDMISALVRLSPDQLSGIAERLLRQVADHEIAGVVYPIADIVTPDEAGKLNQIFDDIAAQSDRANLKRAGNDLLKMLMMFRARLNSTKEAADSAE
jgi:hypothetical protein